MNITLRRAGVTGFLLVLIGSIIACRPCGTTGTPGPSSAGPPYVWICTPGHLPSGGTGPAATMYVFNGGAVAANIAVNFLDSTGNNLAGITVPGSAPPSKLAQQQYRWLRLTPEPLIGSGLNLAVDRDWTG